MTAELVTTAEAGTPEWHNTRTTGIGGSEIAAVVGLSPYDSPYSLWLKKKGLIENQASGEHLGWGNRLEPVVADHFAERHPEFIVATAGTYRAKGRPWQLANVDRLLFAEGDPFPGNLPIGLLEVKTSRFGDGFGPTGSDIIPLHYRCQVMHYMDVLGVEWAYVVVLVGGNEYREYVIDYDKQGAKDLRDAGAAFWKSLQTDDEPPKDASHATFEAVKALHPDIAREVDADLDPSLYARYVSTKADSDTAADAHRLAKTELLAALGDARRGLVGGVPVVRRQPGRGGNVSLHTIKENAA